jgi:import receptor subunit TOM20
MTGFVVRLLYPLIRLTFLVVQPEAKCRPENVEKTRTPYGTHRQIGSAIYTVSSYLGHSCQPSSRPSFASGTSEMSIIACRDLKKGDELTIAFVDVNQHANETMLDCRRRRRVELARGWGFACRCERCTEESKSMTLMEDLSEEQQKDLSRVEDVVSKFNGRHGM